MTIQKNYSKKFNIFVEELLTDKQSKQQELSKVDKELSDCLHFLEKEKVNATILAKINKRIRELRRKRRNIKNDLSDISNVLNKFKNTKRMNETAECEYSYRTDVLLDIITE